jgi:hypothetical protein
VIRTLASTENPLFSQPSMSAAAGTKTPSVTRVPEMHVAVERRAEAVEEGDAAESRAGGCGCVGSRVET